MDDEKALGAKIDRLCDLQERQLSQLTELVQRYKQIADTSQRSHELYSQQAKTWEEDRRSGRERNEQREKETVLIAIILMIIFALIPIAIIVARFL